MSINWKWAMWIGILILLIFWLGQANIIRIGSNIGGGLAKWSETANLPAGTASYDSQRVYRGSDAVLVPARGFITFRIPLDKCVSTSPAEEFRTIQTNRGTITYQNISSEPVHVVPVYLEIGEQSTTGEVCQ